MRWAYKRNWNIQIDFTFIQSYQMQLILWLNWKSDLKTQVN